LSPASHCCFALLEPAGNKSNFIRETLANSPRSDHPRVIVSMSTVHDRINNLSPTIRSLLKQTRPPDEIVLAIPQFSIREQRPYVPKYISRLPRVRVLRCREDYGPATKFIGAIQDELAAGQENTLIMVVDDDRLYPRDALETYLYYSEQLPNAALCFRGAAMPSTLDWDDAKMIHAKDLREPRPVVVITGCGSYLVRPRFFINRSGIIQEPHPLRFILMTFGSAHGSAAAA
jgi:hypothetical protein